MSMNAGSPLIDASLIVAASPRFIAAATVFIAALGVERSTLLPPPPPLPESLPPQPEIIAIIETARHPRTHVARRMASSKSESDSNPTQSKMVETISDRRGLRDG